MSNKKTITLEVELDKDNIPDQIFWLADDANDMTKTECKAMMLSVFDAAKLDTLKIDLWTKEMKIDEMDRFVFQSLRSIVDTYYKATNHAELANEMQKFVSYFGEKTGILKQ